jgi:prepilin-type N-terminal cleavage/methylation domain-containing protein
MGQRSVNFSRGFTLIELILVLAIIATIASIAIPAVANFEKHQRVGETADEIVALARWAQSEAVVRGITFRLNFNPGTGQYWVTRQNGASYENRFQDVQSGSMGLSSGTQTTTTTFSNVLEEPGKMFTAPVGVSFTCNILPQPEGQYIEFRATGRVDPGTIQVTDTSGQTVEIGALSATESYHVLSDEEKTLEQQTPIQQLPTAGAQ